MSFRLLSPRIPPFPDFTFLLTTLSSSFQLLLHSSSFTMASKAPGACCIESNFHEGQPVGKFETVFNLDTYVTGHNNSDSRSIVILTDIYGHKYNNVLLVADQLAKSAGYKVYIPDILKGDPVPASHGDLSPWLKNHSNEITKPIVDGFMKELRAKIGSDAFVGAIGYCFGAKYAIQQIAADGHASAAAAAHPSFVDLEEVKQIKKPLIISAAETDPIFPADLRHQTENALAEIKATYQIDLFSGVSHGFAVRGDLTNPEVRYAADKALTDQIQFFARF